MQTPSAFDPETTRQQLQPLDLGAIHESRLDETSPLAPYTAFYGLDFFRRIEGLAQGMGVFESRGYRISTHVFWPPSPRGTVLVVHGYYDHVGLYRHIIEQLLRLGYAVVAYDLPGHGLSSGPQVAIPDFAVYRDILASLLALKDPHLPRPWHVVAQSTGGAIVMDYLLHEGVSEDSSPFEKVILLAPLIRPANWQQSKLMYYAVRPFREYIKRQFSPSSSDPAFLAFVRKKDPLQSRRLSSQWVGALKNWIPVMESYDPVPVSPIVIQGQQDQTVDWQHNLRVIQEKFRQPKIHYLPEARHHLANEAEPLREEINRILAHYLG